MCFKSQPPHSLEGDEKVTVMWVGPKVRMSKHWKVAAPKAVSSTQALPLVRFLAQGMASLRMACLS